MAIGRKRGSVDAALRRSLRAAVASDWPTAETWLERIVEADSTDLDAYHALARLYREQGAIGRAIRMHQNLLLRRDLPRAQTRETMLELARDFDAGGFGERAAASYEEVLDGEPRHPEALRRLAYLSLEQRDFARGLAVIKKLRRSDADLANRLELDLLMARARMQMEIGESDAARASLKKALKKDKACGEAWTRLGELEAERGKNAKAIDAWREGVLADASTTADLLPRIEAGYAERGKPADYDKFLAKVREARPEDAQVQIAQARTAKIRGQASDAIEILSRALETQPGSAPLQVELGRQLLESGQETEASKAYAKLLDALEQGMLIEAPAEVVDPERDSS